MASAFPAQNGSTPYGVQTGVQSGPRTLTALGRWSILSKQLPPVDTINTIHVYDFDNTRTSPLSLSLFFLMY